MGSWKPEVINFSLSLIRKPIYNSFRVAYHSLTPFCRSCTKDDKKKKYYTHGAKFIDQTHKKIIDIYVYTDLVKWTFPLIMESRNPMHQPPGAISTVKKKKSRRSASPGTVDLHTAYNPASSLSYPPALRTPRKVGTGHGVTVPADAEI